MPLFSVIVPVYNAEKTLERCLASLQSQREPDFEVILIENGSQDASAAICAQFAAGDDRFRLISAGPNQGPSGARNAGLDSARGEWIAFVDSDDYVEPEHLSCLRDTFEAENPDAVFFGYRQISADGHALNIHIPEIEASPELHDQLAQLSVRNLFGYTWIKAFRRETIGHARFPGDLDIFEDEVFACDVLVNCSRIAVVPKTLYNYVTGTPSSLAGRTRPDYPQKCDRAYRAWKKLLNSYGDKEKILVQRANALASNCMYYCFERKIDLKYFTDTLRETEFFAAHTLWSRFDDLVRQRKYSLIKLEKSKYRLKTALAKLIRR